MNKNIFLFLPMLLLILVSACKDDVDPVEDPMTIVETAQATADLSFLVEAVVAADLVDALNSGTFTVFAPNNAAFQALLDSDPAWNGISDIPVDVLTSVLLYHVVEGEVKAADLSDTYVNTLSTGPNMEPLSLQINVTGGVFFDGDAAPLSTDIQTSNGVVHVIDKVMMPNSLVDFALANPNFSILVQALTRPSFNGAYLGALTGTNPLTVFAPTNAAFEALLAIVPTWTTLDDIGDASLKGVLDYHVYAGGNVQSDQLTDGQVIPMLGSGDITIDLSNGVALSTLGGQTVSVAIADVQSLNGVIHVVEQVLLPQ
ncbi:MAG: fasciclin domain-containing protein [Chitinophagales bacterium]|tara:strand:+ start:10930 stop:11874 length:945 start_codon:yes stop_codon:yes gene_type:complete